MTPGSGGLGSCPSEEECTESRDLSRSNSHTQEGLSPPRGLTRTSGTQQVALTPGNARTALQA